MALADCREAEGFVSKALARCKGAKINSLHARGFAITGRGTFDKGPPPSTRPVFLFVRAYVEINQGLFFFFLFLPQLKKKAAPTGEDLQILSEEGRERV